MCARSFQPRLILYNPVDGSPPGSSVREFSRQEYWGGLPCPPLGDLPDAEMEPTSALQVGALPTELPGKPILVVWVLSLSVVYLYHTMGFPGGSEVKASVWNAGDPGSIPGSGRSPGEGNGTPLQYSCLENTTEGGAW